MRSFAVAAIAAVAMASRRVSKEQPCRMTRLEDEPLPEKVITPLQHVEHLPEQHIWNDVDGMNYLTNIRNQHVPQYCGSCWAHAATSAFSDRIKIARHAAWPDINISPQVLISCELNALGCHGGDALKAFEWMESHEITDETCSIYTGRGLDNGGHCSPMTKCRNCYPGEACFIPDEYPVYKAKEFGSVSGEEAMMQEIYQRGPIACGTAVTEDLEANYTGGVYCDESGDMEIVHDVSIVGYGVTEEGEKYWTVRNSWGSHWGEHGFFRICRGKNNLNIESSCSWVVPEDTWTDSVMHNTTQEEQNSWLNDKTVYEFPQPTYKSAEEQDVPAKKGGCRVEEATFEHGEIKHSPHAWEIYSQADLPKTVDWRNMNQELHELVQKSAHPTILWLMLGLGLHFCNC